jgi:tartrate dehydratase alpha subunit/fumarate hydratase class I-like protein
MWMRLRPFFRLRGAHAALECALPVTVQRFDQTINGREYRIEVSAVGSNKWRAEIARSGGGSRAMMPFYGRTPDEAVEHLSHWLAINLVRSTPQV